MNAFVNSGTEPARAGIVAGLRALADLLESHPELPVPDSADTQHTIFASEVPGYKNRLANLERYRDLMVGAGLSVSELVPGAIQVHVSEFPARATYTVHAAEETRAEKERAKSTIDCGFEWPDPDVADADPHVCLRRPGHDGGHKCHCGADQPDVQCASTLDDATMHTHRCALYVDAGPHTDTDHVCECGKQWGGV